MFQWKAVLKGRSPDLVGYLIVVFVTILVLDLLLNVTVIPDGRVRKFVMSSLVSLVFSLLKELISVTAVLKNVSLRSSLLPFLNNTVAYQSILVTATFCFRCQFWHSVISDVVVWMFLLHLYRTCILLQILLQWFLQLQLQA